MRSVLHSPVLGTWADMFTATAELKSRERGTIELTDLTENQPFLLNKSSLGYCKTLVNSQSSGWCGVGAVGASSFCPFFNCFIEGQNLEFLTPQLLLTSPHT